MNTVTVQSLEAEVQGVIEKFHREQQGVTPLVVRVKLVDDMIIVHSTGIFTAVESDLLRDENGRKLVTTARREHRSLTRDAVEAAVAKAVRCGVKRSYYDLDVRVGEQIEIYELSDNLSAKLAD